MDDLLNKTGMDNKFEVVRLAINRVKQLIKEKERMGLLGSNEKLTSIALKEIMEGKLKPENLKGEIKNREEERNKVNTR